MRVDARKLTAASMVLFGAGSLSLAVPDQFQTCERYRLDRAETHEGDLYVGAGQVRVEGAVNGDLVAWAANVWIPGEVRGDLLVAGAQLDVNGHVGDSTRLFVGEAQINGTIDGDLMVFGGELSIGPDAQVTGDLVMMGGRAEILGTVGRKLTFLGGEITLGGVIESDVKLEADRIKLLDGAEIRGDLEYTSRKELEREDGAKVLGNIEFEPKEEDDDDDSSFFGWAFWSWLVLGSMVVGMALMALLRRFAPLVVERIEREGLLAGVVGFVTFLVVPMAAALAMLPLVTIPLAALAAILFAVLIYLAKLPVAYWLGRLVLGRLGRGGASPYLALALGLLLLYLMFEIPYLGGIVWLVTAWLGLGSIILAIRSYRAA